MIFLIHLEGAIRDRQKAKYSQYHARKSTPEVDFADADAAMAWLEGLAAKQGVSEDELLTSPEDRGDRPPDWMHATEDTTTAETERQHPSKNQS